MSTLVLPAHLASSWKVGKKLGQGTYGSVHLVTKLQEPHRGNQFAVKRVILRDPVLGIDISTMGEISLLSRLNHPNIIHMEDVYYDPHTHVMYEFLELASGGDLSKKIDAWFAPGMLVRKQNDIQERIQMLYGMVCGLNYLHSNDILHLDLKPANILIDQAGVAKLADFGLSEREGGSKGTGENKVTWPWRSPELFCGTSQYHASSDVWSLGVIICSMFFSINPFWNPYSDLTEDDLFQEMKSKIGFPARHLLALYAQYSTRCNSTYEELRQAGPSAQHVSIVSSMLAEHIPTYKQYYGDVFYDVVDLIHACLVFDPTARITAKDMKNHPLFDANAFCKSCHCDEVETYHIPSNKDVHVDPKLLTFLSARNHMIQFHFPPSLLSYTREIIKRVEEHIPVKTMEEQCLCASVAAKLLMQSVHFPSLFRELIMMAYDLPPSTSLKKFKEYANGFSEAELGISRLLHWNFDGPPAKNSSTSQQQRQQLAEDQEEEEEEDGDEEMYFTPQQL